MSEQSKCTIFKLCQTKLSLLSILASETAVCAYAIFYTVSLKTRHPLVTIISLNLKPIFSDKFLPLRRSRSLNVTNKFGTSGKPVCVFLLVNNDIWHVISHRLRDMKDYWSFAVNREVVCFNAVVRDNNDNEYRRLNVMWNNSLRRIFDCCWRESVSGLLFYTQTLPICHTRLIKDKFCSGKVTELWQYCS